MDFKIRKSANIKIDLEKLSFVSSIMNAMNESYIGPMGSYLYYQILEKKAKTRLNIQALAALLSSLTLVGGFVFIGTISFYWIQAWTALALIDIMLVFLLGRGHRSYIAALDPMRLKYITLHELKPVQLQEIVKLGGKLLPSKAYLNEIVALEINKTYQLTASEIDIFQSLAWEYEGTIEELYVVAKNLAL